jgi:hypothetical protein
MTARLNRRACRRDLAHRPNGRRPAIWYCCQTGVIRATSSTVRAMLIAEDMLLLLTDDDTGKAAGSTQVDLGLAGALMADLALLGRVDIAAAGEQVKKGRLVVRDASPTDDDLLDGALSRLSGQQGKRADKAVEALTKDTRRQLYLRLAERGLVRQHESRLFGVTLRTTWPAAERTHEQLLRASLALAVSSDRDLQERDAALLSVLAAVGRIDVVAGGAQTALTGRDIRHRNRDLSARWWVSDAVSAAVKRANATSGAVAASVTSTAVIASS